MKWLKVVLRYARQPPVLLSTGISIATERVLRCRKGNKQSLFTDSYPNISSIFKNTVMKFLLTGIIFFLVPLILCSVVIYTAVTLFIQHFFPVRKPGSVVVYPYQTSWEEAA